MNNKRPLDVPGVLSVYVDQSRELFHNRGNNLGESVRVSDREVSQHLPVEDDIAGAHESDQAAVCGAIQTRSGVDTGDPQTAQVALAAAAVSVGIPLSLHKGLIGALIEMIAGTFVTLIAG